MKIETSNIMIQYIVRIPYILFLYNVRGCYRIDHQINNRYASSTVFLSYSLVWRMIRHWQFSFKCWVLCIVLSVLCFVFSMFTCIAIAAIVCFRLISSNVLSSRAAYLTQVYDDIFSSVCRKPSYFCNVYLVKCDNVCSTAMYHLTMF